ncbi:MULTISPECIES: hypothetical protein [Bacillaceae]|uniref:hypothetical protein n=1 Tax=Bacillaceae TaxID=186817 RepID=UPI001E5F772B|nr:MULTISPECIES: hypothetical protein [Bacillaceae]MCE4050730.1 hypothetical protein [Bacillus sp. Au-Bac7]MCM3031649.1 hypothetical protein [Niallia sp. MER 6]UPO89831.1 hypothetical protein L8T27_023850 [Niallia sp. Man26]
MDHNLHELHKHVKFSDEVLAMFIDIIGQDPSLLKVFQYIAIEEQRNKERGVSISHIIENVKVERLVRKTVGKNKYVYEEVFTNIERKNVEKMVDKLMFMSLIYHEAIKPYKFLFLTNRGKQLIAKLVENKSKDKELRK